jgi:hypothetical protein
MPSVLEEILVCLRSESVDRIKTFTQRNFTPIPTKRGGVYLRVPSRFNRIDMENDELKACKDAADLLENYRSFSPMVADAIVAFKRIGECIDDPTQ